jgi:hypothetical protein
MKRSRCINEFKPTKYSTLVLIGAQVIKTFLMDPPIFIHFVFSTHANMLLGKVEPKNEIVTVQS